MKPNLDLHKFVIELDGMGRGKVEMDGQPVKGVIRVVFEGASGEPSIVTLTMHAAVLCKTEASVE